MKQQILCFTALLMAGCGMNMSDEDARQVAVEWADAYFNCDYHAAADYVTHESEKWLRFAASNTREADLQLLREKPATVEADDIILASDDTLRVVKLTVSNALSPVAIGEEPGRTEEGVFAVTVVKRDAGWKVRMEGLPRSEKQSRD